MACRGSLSLFGFRRLDRKDILGFTQMATRGRGEHEIPLDGLSNSTGDRFNGIFFGYETIDASRESAFD